ncbi:MAG: carboxypeptidase-like regulatory domain-containing protein [Ignavibacteriales bacterium]|nr:carboxypeptidase-like regulatory domain-containing protein [Ignavibacteriales bacterium]
MRKILLLFLLVPFIIYSGTTGKLAGTIKDAQTGEPLVGANVIIEGTNFGAATNVEWRVCYT